MLPADTKLSALADPTFEWSESDLPLGDQEPTHRLVPPADGSHGHDAIEFASYCGIELMPFQAQGLIDDLGWVWVEQPDGTRVERWAAQETEEIVSRRNGKTVRLVVLILFALFVLGEQKILYTAHRDDTAKDVFDEVVKVLKRVPRLWAEVVDSGPRYTNGQRSIQLKSGAIVYFRTRGTDAGRGQGYDRLIFDEDQNLSDEEHSALLPLATGAPNAQVNHAGSAGGKESVIQSRTWEQYKKGSRGLCYRGWHLDADDEFDNVHRIARVNPRFGRGLSTAFIVKEHAKFSRARFGRERCGVATWPRAEGESWVIPQPAVLRATDEKSTIAKGAPLAFVLEAMPDLARGSICVAGRRPDGAMHLEPVANQPDVLWIPDRAKRLHGRHSGSMWLDPKGPLGYLVDPLREAGVPVSLFDAADLKDAATWLYTGMNPQPVAPDDEPPEPTIYHRGAPRLLQAFASAETRKLLDRWTLRRSVSQEVDQSPLVGSMLAGWAVVKTERRGRTPLPRKVSGSSGSAYRPQPTGRRRSPDIRTAGF